MKLDMKGKIMSKQNIDGSKVKIYIRDMSTGEYIPFEEIAEISDVDIISDDDELNEVVKKFYQELSFSCEIESLPEFYDSSEKKKPNPIYAPKHIAKRRKW